VANQRIRASAAEIFVAATRMSGWITSIERRALVDVDYLRNVRANACVEDCVGDSE
jgi:hypothetical protein